MQRDRRGAAAGGTHLLLSPGEGMFCLHRMAVGPLGPPTVSHGAGHCPAYSTSLAVLSLQVQHSPEGSEQEGQRDGNQGPGEKGGREAHPRPGSGEQRQAAGRRQGQRCRVSPHPDSHQTILPQTPTCRNMARLCAKGRKTNVCILNMCLSASTVFTGFADGDCRKVETEHLQKVFS